MAKEVPISPNTSNKIPAIRTLRLPKRMKSTVANGESPHVNAHAIDEAHPVAKENTRKDDNYEFRYTSNHGNQRDGQ